MAGKLDRKVKMALDETRLLVLGIQVLLGFQFQAFFQTGFPRWRPPRRPSAQEASRCKSWRSAS